MKYYYAVFKRTPEAIEVEFPDLTGCVTFGNDWEEAIENAADALAGWLANAERKFVKPPSRYETLRNEYPREQLIPIPLDEKLLERYSSRRFKKSTKAVGSKR